MSPFEDDDYYWLNFYNDHHLVSFETREDLDNSVRTNLPRVFARIDQGQDLIIRKNSKDLLFDIIQKSKSFTDLIFTHKTEVEEIEIKIVEKEDENENEDECKALTKKGNKCSNLKKNGDYCARHKNYVQISIETCKAITKKGKVCGKKTTNGDLCGTHKNGSSFSGKVEIRFDDYITRNPDICPRYSQIIFEPNPDGQLPDSFNLWCGFKAKRVKKVNEKLIEPLLIHIKEVLADNNEERYDYILSWLASIIQTPWIKTRRAMMLKSDQQCGKGTFTYFLSKYVFGTQLSTTCSGFDHILGQFNSILQNKLIVIVDEPSVVQDSFHSQFDKFKNLITDVSGLRINKKGIESFSVQNYSNFILTTNHDRSVKIESKDKRYVIFELSNHRQGDKKYFDDLMSSIYNDKAGNHFYSFLLNYKICDLGKIPKSELKDALIELNYSSPQQFIRKIHSGSIKFQEPIKMESGELKFDEKGKIEYIEIKVVKASDIYKRYLKWIENSGENKTSQTKFGIEIRSLFDIKNGGKFNKSGTIYYDLSKINIGE